MPAKNVDAFIEQTIHSILNQTISDWELIAVDDHSTDQTYTLLSTATTKDPRIKVIPNKGKGIADALQTGYQKCSGNFITRMDADDLMEPQKLQLLRQKLQSAGEGFVATGKVNYFSNQPIGDGYLKYANWLNELTDKESNFSDIYKECVIPSPCWMMYRSDLIKIGGIATGVYPEDYDLCFRMFAHQLNVTSVKKIIHQWRDYPERTSRNDPNYADNRFFDLKLSYFFQLTYQKDKQLLLLGAGKKAKRIAKTIIEKKIQFEWLTNNVKKIGHQVYDQIIKDIANVGDYQNPQIIIAISNPLEQENIDTQLKKMGLKLGETYYFFC